MAKSTLDLLAAELAKIVRPLNKATSSPEQAQGLIQALGWQLPPGINDIGLTGLSVQPVIDKLGELIYTTPEEEQDTLLMATRSAQLIAAVGNLVQAVRDVINAISTLTGVSGDYLNKTQIQQQLLPRLLDYLIIKYTRRYHPGVFALLQLLGVFELESFVEDSAKYQSRHVRHRVWFQRIGTLISAPTLLPNKVYGWGTSNADIAALLINSAQLLQVLGAQATLYDLRQRAEEQLLKRPVPEAAVNPMPELYVTLVQGFGLEDLEVGLSMFGIRPTVQGGTDAGVGVTPYSRGTTETEIPIVSGWSIEIESKVDTKGGIALLLRPDNPIEARTGLFSSGNGTTMTSGHVLGKLCYKTGKDGSFEIMSIPGIAYLEADKIWLGGGAKMVSSTQFDFCFTTGLQGGRFVFDPSESDSFIGKIVPSEGFKVDFGFAIEWSKVAGLCFQGSGSLEIRLPVHIGLLGIEIESLTLGIGISGRKVPFYIGASMKADLGPLKASVENIGAKVTLTFPDNNDGNLGPLDLSLGFKPPKGVGLSIDAGVVKGGGYLYFDFDREEYAGALELVFSEWIALKAVGLITTKMPDGSKGFSLLVIITAEFGTGIQLGFGFTLLGVGGLLGLNRTVNIEPLKDGIRTGAVESVMFPQDVVANAPRIISDLRRFFPPVRDIFLVGPMAKIGWGTPTLISASLGVILEFPSVNITILGVVKVVLPYEKKDILRLQVNFIGRLEPSNKLLWFYAELFDSRVLFITLEGGMGLLLNWGDNANFVVSVGGFHPRYSPPPLPFPEPPRLAANILNESWARVRIEGYFAVTSNSVQFGARAELYFGLSEFRLEGHLGFDALFQFNPFFFSFSLSFSLSVKVFGLGLWSVGFSGLLEGPTPWHIKGKGKISLFFFSISVPFEHTWGGRRETTLEPIEVLPLLEKEFKALTNWEAVVPTSSNLLVSLRKLGKSETDQLVLHPVGKLRISQRKVPLDFKMDKVGNQRPADVHRVSVDAAIPGGGSLSISERQEKFAIGQFKDLDEAARLSSPAFEPMESGIEIAIAGEQMKTSQAVKRVIRYETIIIDNNFKRDVKKFFEFFTTGFAVLYNFLFGHFLKGNAVTKSVLSQHHKKRIQPFEEVIHIQPNQYSVAFHSNNRPVGAGAAAFTSQAKAMEYMQQQIQSDPKLANNLHVIPNSEVNLAA